MEKDSWTSWSRILFGATWQGASTSWHSDGWHVTKTTCRMVRPTWKDVQKMRELLRHYFQPFNLQHNRVAGRTIWWNLWLRLHSKVISLGTLIMSNCYWFCYFISRWTWISILNWTRCICGDPEIESCKDSGFHFAAGITSAVFFSVSASAFEHLCNYPAAN